MAIKKVQEPLILQVVRTRTVEVSEQRPAGAMTRMEIAETLGVGSTKVSKILAELRTESRLKELRLRQVSDNGNITHVKVYWVEE